MNEPIDFTPQADPEACQTCGQPFAAPECAVCFDARWTLDSPHPLASLVINRGAIAPNA